MAIQKVVQVGDGQLLKCAPDNDGGLQMRLLTSGENDDFVRRKTQRLNLVEYFGSGGRSTQDVEEISANEEGWRDFVSARFLL